MIKGYKCMLFDARGFNIYKNYYYILNKNDVVQARTKTKNQALKLINEFYNTELKLYNKKVQNYYIEKGVNMM